MVAQPVVDVQVKIEARSRHTIELVGQEMLDVNQALERSPAVKPGRLGSLPVIVNHRHASDLHRWASRG
jgi:hypothetical protein